jgi:hypothetical protein
VVAINHGYGRLSFSEPHMYTLTYSSSFRQNQTNPLWSPLDTDPEVTTTGKVLVLSPVDASALIRKWNENSQQHCKGLYRYRHVGLERATKQEIETLDLY